MEHGSSDIVDASGPTRGHRAAGRLDAVRSAGRPQQISIALVVIVLVVQLVGFPMPAGAWLQGVVLGLLNALVVLGLMLIYRANRVVNLAQASMGTMPAALGVGLILLGGLGIGQSAALGLAGAAMLTAGLLVLRIAGRTTALAAGVVAFVVMTGGLFLGGHFGYFGGLVTGLVTAVVCGIGVDLIVVQRLQRAPRLILTVATVGLAQFFSVGALLVPRLWHATVLLQGKTPTYGVPFHLDFTLSTQAFHADDVAAVVVAIVCLIAVTLLLRRSDVGTAIRASADRSDRAAMLGVPVLRLETIVWVVASVLSFLGVFLQGAILGFPINASVGLTGLVAGLAAMAMGGFADLPITLLAAVVIGVLDKGVAWNHPNRPASVYAVLAVVILVGLLARPAGRRRVDTDTVSSWQASSEPRAVPQVLRRLPEVRLARWGGGALVLALAFAFPLMADSSSEFRASTVVCLAILALSVVILTGWGGEVTLGQMAFAAVGGAVGTLATVQWQWDLSLALLLAGAAGAAAAIVVGLPALRLHGLFLAVTTLAFALAASGTLLNPTVATWIPVSAVTRRPLFGAWSLENHDGSMYEVCLVVLVLALVAVAGIRRSRTGRILRAVRDNPKGAQAFGVRAVVARLTAFAFSGFLAGISGCLLVYLNGQYDPTTFAPEQGLNVFISAVVGGVGTAVGAIFGALVLDGARNWLNGPEALLPTAVGVLGVILLLPGGLADLAYRVRDAFLRVVANRRSLIVPSLVADVRPADDTAVLAAATGATDLAETSAAPATAAPPAVAPAAEPGWLSVRDLTVAYGGVQVLFDVGIDIVEGEITALLGTNGAGKSTLLKAIGGVAPVTGGTIHLGGVDLCTLRPEEIAAQGIGQMPGGQGVFPSLTVQENLRVASWLIRRDTALVHARTEGVLTRFPVLRQRLGDEAANLSGGQQQQLALAMALLTEPRLLLVDELSLGLAPSVVDMLLGQLRELRDHGTTIVVVEQSVNLALKMADHAYFMEKGEMRFSGPAQELLDQPDLVRSVYLHGAEAGLRDHATTGLGAPDGTAPASGPATAPRSGTALEVRGLSVAFGGIAAVQDVDIDVAAGEIVGIIGPNGAGKTTLFDLISGFTRSDHGRVVLHGTDIAALAPSTRARAGLGRSFQDARLFAGLTVAETIAVSLERWIEGGDLLSGAFRLPANQLAEAAVAERVDALVGLFGLEAFRDKLIGELSTGSRRMVDLACVIAHGPSVVLLDEPSSGIAQREAEALAPLILRIRDQLDASLLIIEHDMSLITTVADRLVALDQGEVVTAGLSSEVLAHPQVVASYLGTGGEALHRSDPLLTSPEGAPS